MKWKSCLYILLKSNILLIYQSKNPTKKMNLHTFQKRNIGAQSVGPLVIQSLDLVCCNDDLQEHWY